MEIHFQTTDHAVAVEKEPEQHIGTKYSKCNNLRVISHIITSGKSAITHSKVGQCSPNPKNAEEHKNSLGKSNLPKMCNCSTFRENCVTHPCMHVRPHMVQIIISRQRAIVFKLQPSLNSENLKVVIAQRCHELQVYNFTML